MFSGWKRELIKLNELAAIISNFARRVETIYYKEIKNTPLWGKNIFKECEPTFGNISKLKNNRIYKVILPVGEK